MARNRHGQRIGSACLRDRAYRIWRTDQLCYVCVAYGRACWNISKRLPDPLLEGGSTDIERKVEAECRRLDKSDHFRHEPFKIGIAADEIGFGKLVLQLAYKRVRVVPQKNCADATAALSYEDRAERTFAHGEADVSSFAAGAIA